MKYSERIYPDWFIDELVNEEDKEKARNGLLKSTDKVVFKCKNNHVHYEQKVLHHIKLSTREKLQGCPVCGKLNKCKNRMKSISSKRTYPDWFINELVNEEDKEKARNGELMNHSKVKFRCDKCGNVYEQIVVNHIKISTGERRNGCPICGKTNRVNNFIKTVSYKRIYPQWFIDELLNEDDKENARNGTLTSNSKVEFKCDKCGNVYKQVICYHIRLSNGEKKSGCPICGEEKRKEKFLNTISGKRIYPDWFIEELVNEDDKIKAMNGILNTLKLVEFKCNKCGNVYKQRIDNHIKLSSGERKYGCPICGKLKLNKNRMKTISGKRIYPDWFIEELVNEDDKERARSGSLMNRSKVEFKCDKGHVYKQIVNDHIKLSNGEKIHGCPICMHFRSKTELEINEFIELLGYKTEHRRFRDSNNRTFEIDIFIPEKNVGIEYNGSVYHSSENGVYRNLDKFYHYNKFNECRIKDILLITIFDIELESKREEIEQYIKDILEGNENKLSYDKEGYMNNNYPSWKYYKNSFGYIEATYNYKQKYIVYTCGYSAINI